jgi:protein-tyrosine phosphatase
VKTLLGMGKKVIIAHAERIRSFQKDIEPLLGLMEQGLEIQLNIGSFLDEFDVKCTRTAHKLLAAGCAHYLASDAHSATRRRPPTISEWNSLEELLGNETLTRLCITNPAKLLADR